METKKNQKGSVWGAEYIRPKVVAVYPVPLPSLQGLDRVKVLNDSTVVKCHINSGKAEIPENILWHSAICGVKRMGKYFGAAPSPSFAITVVENSALKIIDGKEYPGWAIVPVNLDGSAPKGTVPKNPVGYSGNPTAYVNHVTDIIIMLVSDFFSHGQNTDYLSAVHFTIDPKSGQLANQLICDRVAIKLSRDNWKDQVLEAIDEKYLDAAISALDLAWGIPQEHPTWVSDNGKVS